MKFVFDENIPYYVVECLKLVRGKLDYEAVHLVHDGLAPAGTSDIEIFRDLPSECRYIVTMDNSIRKRQNELRAWKQSGRTTFFLAKKYAQKPLIQKPWMIMKWWPIILDTAKDSAETVGYLVPCHEKAGVLKELY